MKDRCGKCCCTPRCVRARVLGVTSLTIQEAAIVHALADAVRGHLAGLRITDIPFFEWKRVRDRALATASVCGDEEGVTHGLRLVARHVCAVSCTSKSMYHIDVYHAAIDFLAGRPRKVSPGLAELQEASR